MKYLTIKLDEMQLEYFKKHKVIKPKIYFEDHYDIIYNSILNFKRINEDEREKYGKEWITVPETKKLYQKNKLFYLNYNFLYGIIEGSILSPEISKLIKKGENNITKFRKVIRNTFDGKLVDFFLLISPKIFDYKQKKIPCNLCKEVNFIGQLVVI